MKFLKNSKSVQSDHSPIKTARAKNVANEQFRLLAPKLKIEDLNGEKVSGARYLVRRTVRSFLVTSSEYENWKEIKNSVI